MTMLGKQLFPTNNPWNQDISKAPVMLDSAAKIAKVAGAGLKCDFGWLYNSRLNGIPVTTVDSTTPRVPVKIRTKAEGGYAEESDLAALPIPVPANALAALVEGDLPNPVTPDTGNALNSDRHLILYDKDAHVGYELSYVCRPGERRVINADGTVSVLADPSAGWSASQLSYWDYKTNATRPDGWTSADAAGLPILPGLVRYDEILESFFAGREDLGHPLRVTFAQTTRAYVFPATHCTYSGPTAPDWVRMGERLRLRADFDVDGYCDGAKVWQSNFDARINRVILKTLQKYGMIVADNGGNGFISGVPDQRWNVDVLKWLEQFVKMSDFAVVDGNAGTLPQPPPTPAWKLFWATPLEASPSTLSGSTKTSALKARVAGWPAGIAPKLCYRFTFSGLQSVQNIEGELIATTSSVSITQNFVASRAGLITAKLTVWDLASPSNTISSEVVLRVVATHTAMQIIAPLSGATPTSVRLDQFGQPMS
jgi:hypothetical protein